ncbi:hypothetical protein X975_25971, partial [Stegodyphus mimosarum]
MVINFMQHSVTLMCAASTINPRIDVIPPARQVSSPMNAEFVCYQLRSWSTIHEDYKWIIQCIIISQVRWKKQSYLSFVSSFHGYMECSDLRHSSLLNPGFKIAICIKYAECLVVDGTYLYLWNSWTEAFQHEVLNAWTEDGIVVEAQIAFVASQTLYVGCEASFLCRNGVQMTLPWSIFFCSQKIYRI